MNTASLVMREWRRAQIVQIEVPDKVRAANVSALAVMWSEVDGLANERLLAAQTAWDVKHDEAEDLLNQLVDIFEEQHQNREIEQEQIRAQAHQIAQQQADSKVLRAELAAATARAGAAETRVADLDRRAGDLAAELGRVHAVGMAERDRLTKAEADRDQERRDAGKAREEAARLQGMVDAMTQQAKKEGSA